MLQGSARDQLRSLVERLERLDEEKRALAEDMKELFAQAKSTGFDVKALKQILKERRQDADERRDLEAIVDTYRTALGMLDGTPLGESAIASLQTAH
jgi:uncharacterized protein (UPF0335 family)